MLMRALGSVVGDKAVIGARGASRMAAILLAAAVLFGGQSVFLTFVQAIPQVIGVVALAYGAWHWRAVIAAQGAGAMLAIAAAAVALVVALLVPLPFAWWSALPGRDVAVAMLSAGPGGTPW